MRLIPLVIALLLVGSIYAQTGRRPKPSGPTPTASKSESTRSSARKVTVQLRTGQTISGDRICYDVDRLEVQVAGKPVLIKMSDVVNIGVEAPSSSLSPPKSEIDLAIEKDETVLSSLSPENKAAVRAALQSYERTIRVYQLRYDKTFLIGLTLDGTEKIWNQGDEALPASGLKNVLSHLRREILDASTADTYYREGIGDDAFLAIVDRYKLQGTSPILVGTKVIRIAEQTLVLAKRFAVAAQIMESPLH
jgi:hypothetical protein